MHNVSYMLINASNKYLEFKADNIEACKKHAELILKDNPLICLEIERREVVSKLRASVTMIEE